MTPLLTGGGRERTILRPQRQNRCNATGDKLRMEKPALKEAIRGRTFHPGCGVRDAILTD
jgi:hypothetical protein